MSKIVKSKKDIIKAVAGALLLLIILDLTPLGGNIAYYVKWAQCGQQPFYTSKGAGFASGVPNYRHISNFGFLRGVMPYYCTARDAELAGYSANPKQYDFPHLTTQDEQTDAYRNARKLQNN